jgi:hypothetical protein
MPWPGQQPIGLPAALRARDLTRAVSETHLAVCEIRNSGETPSETHNSAAASTFSTGVAEIPLNSSSLPFDNGLHRMEIL